MAQLSLFKSKRQHGVKAPPAKEINTHFMVADTLRRWQTPGWRWTHFPAGEWRHPGTAMRLKRMGVQVGWPDFILLSPKTGAGSILNPLTLRAETLFPGRVHFLELKRKGQKLSEFQEAFAGFCISNGYAYYWADNFKDALAQLKTWGAVRASVTA